MQADADHRFIFEHLDVRGELVHLDESLQNLLSLHHYPGPVAHLLGEFLAAAVLLSNSMKTDGTLALQVRGEGPIQLLLVECTDRSLVRGMAQFSQQAVSDDFATLLAGSILTLTFRPLNGTQYQAIVPVEGANLAECLGHYFQQSEQLNTTFMFSCDGHQAGGLMLQQLPAQLVADPALRQDHWTRLTLSAQTLSATELLQVAPAELLPRLYPEDAIRLFDAHQITYRCRCSRARTARILATLAREEVDAMLAAEAHIDMTCELCNQLYRFDQASVDAIFRGDFASFDEALTGNDAPPSTTRH